MTRERASSWPSWTIPEAQRHKRHKPDCEDMKKARNPLQGRALRAGDET